MGFVVCLKKKRKLSLLSRQELGSKPGILHVTQKRSICVVAHRQQIVLIVSLSKQPHTRRELEICARTPSSNYKYVAQFDNIQADGLKRQSSLAPLRLGNKFLVKILHHAEKRWSPFCYTLLCYYFTVPTYDTKATVIIIIIIIIINFGKS